MIARQPTKGRIIVSGILFWYPLAGVAYQFLHYLIGLRRLGYDVFYIEDSGRLIYDPNINDLSPDASGNVSAVAPLLERHGFSGRWAFRGAYPGGRCYGLSEEDILRLYREADGFLNVTGAQEMRDEHMCLRRRVYVESDPFASQVKVSQGDPATTAALQAHHVHFTFGENVGARDCLVPTGQFDWLPTRQPVILELWEDSCTGGEAYGTITTWSNKDKNIVYRGDTYYWTKDREFERFLELPRRRSDVKFELAARVGGDVPERLRSNGWTQLDSVDISTDADRYRQYIQRSRGEFTVARDQYVRPRTGWFSDRSACYLAAGRPVITQETGFSKFIASGKGLFGFHTMDDVLAAVDSIESDYAGHCRAAKEIAAEYFAAEKVLAHLMSRAGLQ
jgi:hypothetical protein